jgi:methylthioribose-1-phosphate isomerase
MVVRGAPVIGVAGAMGMALAALESKANTKRNLIRDLERAQKVLERTRPTGVNLPWATQRLLNVARSMEGKPGPIVKAIVEEAKLLADEDLQANRALGRCGAALLRDGDVVLTHCNAGALATVGYGTALGVVRAAIEQGKRIEVFATETRPKLQGARLTTFELAADKIPVTLVADSMVGYLMENDLIDKVLVGADRIVATGHVFNKIGTSTIAIVADYYNVPFYVAAPKSSFDLAKPVDRVEIEQRDPMEVRMVGTCLLAPRNIPVCNPAFDMTTPQLISAIITEKGIIRPPYRRNIRRILGGS